jgi:hypothetical protein
VPEISLSDLKKRNKASKTNGARVAAGKDVYDVTGQSKHYT